MADLSITKSDGGNNVNGGGSTVYTITVSNNGPSSVTGAILADPVTAGLTKTVVVCSATPGACVTAPTVVQLEGGSFALPLLASSGTYQITVTANVTAASGSVSNTATVATPAGITDPTPGNNSATDTDTVIAAPVVADLSITKSNGVSSIKPGATTVYTVAVTNNGPGEVTGATVTDLAPAGLILGNWTCVASTAGTGGVVTTACGAASGSGNLNTTVTMKAGAVITYTVPATVADDMAGNLVNIATVNPPVGVSDSALGNNSATDSDAITSGPPIPVAPIPTLGPLELGLLVLLLGAMSARIIRLTASGDIR